MWIAYETDTADMDRSPDRNSMDLHTVVPKAGGVPDQTRSALPFKNLAEAVQED